MDKYEKKVRINQIRSLIENGEYQEAQEIADTIDWKQERSIRTLRMVSEVYKINRRYEDALNVLALAYQKDPEDPIKRKIVYDLCELTIKMGQVGLAVQYMKEFSKMAPTDAGRYILQYKLLKATDADNNERIELLEEFNSKYFSDYDGRWAYELAVLYHETGKNDKCVDCCNEIMLWFVTGPIVAKALKLKSLHQELTYEEKQKLLAEDGEYGEEVLYQKRHKTETAPVYMNTTPIIGDGYSATDAEDRIDGQDALVQVQSVDELPEKPEPEEQGLSIEVKKVDPSLEPTIRMAEKKTGPSILSRETTVLPDVNKALSGPSVQPASQHIDNPPVDDRHTAPPTIDPSAVAGAYPDPRDDKDGTVPIQIPPAIPGVEDAITQTGTIAQQEISVNLDKYSTMNLQAELRENMEKLQEQTGEPLREREEKLPDRVAGPDKDLTEIKAKRETKPMAQTVSAADTLNKAVQSDSRAGEAPPSVKDDPAKPGEMSQEEIASKITSVPVPEQFKNIISQEKDGQMQLNVPEEDQVDEKQITGQMDIESILATWDKLQEEARDRRIRAAKRKSLEQTNELAKEVIDRLPGYEAPQEEDVPVEPQDKSGSEPLSSASLTSAYTGPLVVPANETGEVNTEKIEEALKNELEQELHERKDETPGDETSDKYRDEEIEEEIPQDNPEQEYKDENEGYREHGHSSAGDSEAAEPTQDDSNQEAARKKTGFVTYETVELPSVFDSFRHIKGLPPQLKDAEDKMSMESGHGNVLIVGSEHAARMELVQALVRDMSEKNPKGEIKAASIDADTFNSKDVDKSLKALAGNMLVIEAAGRLSDDAMNSMLSVLSGGDSEILVILEDSRGGAKNLSEYSGFADVFDVTIDMPTLSNDYLVNHAKSYAGDKGYILDDMAVLALYQRIDERQTADHVVTSDEVEHIIDLAIKSANKKNLKHLGDVLLGKRYNDEDLIVLREKDFAK
ncbi:MAG: hypothetical protein K6G42_08380 [Lachnospiraceae bacterium]|nr:hypothetical protein [Lachnospiraceae bacterium]